MICCFKFICSKFLKYHLCFVVKSQHKKIPNFVSFKKTVPNLIFRKVSKLWYELRQDIHPSHYRILLYWGLYTKANRFFILSSLPV